ncbi:MAG: hypothetical protein O2857_09710 [Planctomycetota bacterium]|nr:hypothetical protein [Planctomycetota bacterium]
MYPAEASSAFKLLNNAFRQWVIKIIRHRKFALAESERARGLVAQTQRSHFDDLFMLVGYKMVSPFLTI